MKVWEYAYPTLFKGGMIMKKKALALLLSVAMTVGLAACGSENASTPESAASDATEAATEAAQETAEGTDEAAGSDTLVVGYSAFSGKFSPFFSATAYDTDAQEMTQLYLIAQDRTGAVVYNGIEGETIAYNGTDYTYYGPADITVTQNDDGTVYYDFKLREDLKFSDGEPLTVDDIIFSMYVLCDPTYDGSFTLYAQPIEGMEAYRSGMSTLASLLAAAGEDNTDFTNWTEEQQTAFWDAVNDGGVAFAQEIVDYVIAAGYNTAEDSVAACAANWGFELDESADVKDFFLAIGDNYGWNFSSMEAESAGSALADLIPEEVYNYSTTGVSTGESAASITGIQKIDDYNLRVVTTEFDATTIYQLAIEIAPLHYYGDDSLYDYDNNMFGFEKGDLSGVRAKTSQPMGAGAYKFIEFTNGTIYYEANENYFKGEPKTKYVNFLQCMTDDDKVNGITTGTIDITDPNFTNDTIEVIKGANDNGDLTGNVVSTSTVDNLGYGYIGICADNVKVGDDASSEESKDLRKAFATIFSVYRDVAIDSYYGERASVINYPISNTSWAAPQATDDDYEIAFSKDVNGDPIYTSDMSADEKYAAAKEAALGFLEAAGYTVEDGKVTAAPEGAALEYEVQIPADGSGDHPAFMVLTLAHDALAELGINLIVTDLSNSSDLWTSLDAIECDMWAAAWQATVDPDMYQIYHSSNRVGEPGATGSNHYRIADEDLDEMIMLARTSADQSYRKLVYKDALDIILDWAVEIPIYQRQNAFVFSTERVNMDTMTPDITTFYGWDAEIENIQMN